MTKVVTGRYRVIKNAFFSALHFGENFMKIRPKIEKLQMFIHIFMKIFMSNTKANPIIDNSALY